MTLGLLASGFGAAHSEPLDSHQSQAPPNNAPSEPDPEYVPSIIDLVRPSIVRGRAIDVVGGRYAGGWIEGDVANEHYVIAIVDPTAEDAVQIEARLPGIPFEVVARSIPLAELEALRDTIVANVRPGPERIISVSAGPFAGRVLIGIQAETARSRATEEIEAATGQSLSNLPVDIGVAAAPIEEDTVTSFPPYKAGKLVGIGSAAYNCTTGFAIGNAFGKFGTTAGHCGGLTDSVWLNGAQRDHVRNNVLFAKDPAESDALAFLLDDGEESDDLYRSSTVTRDVSGQYSEADMMPPTRVCMRGAATDDQTCGDLVVDNVDVAIYEPWPVDRFVNNQYCWEPIGSMGGDSGAPHYRVQSDGSVWAMGVHNGKADPDHDGTLSTCYSAIGPTLAEFSASLLTK